MQMRKKGFAGVHTPDSGLSDWGQSFLNYRRIVWRGRRRELDFNPRLLSHSLGSQTFSLHPEMPLF